MLSRLRFQGVISNLYEVGTIPLVCVAVKLLSMFITSYIEECIAKLTNELFISGSKSNVYLDWPKRAVICMGTASGLAFLHEEAKPHIVHRDIKASNVLLDKDFNPKIGDFGLAKLFPDNVTHVSTRVAGTM